MLRATAKHSWMMAYVKARLVNYIGPIVHLVGELHKQARWPDGPCPWLEALIDAGRTTACTIWADKDTHSAYVRTWYTHAPTHKHTHAHTHITYMYTHEQTTPVHTCTCNVSKHGSPLIAK